MRSPVISIVLCGFVQAATAQCAPATQIGESAARPESELIKIAAAGSREGQAVLRAAPAPHSNVEPKRHRKAGTAMLLAALALMSGIALRRYTAPRQ
jgi:hypothetical protein